MAASHTTRALLPASLLVAVLTAHGLEVTANPDEEAGAVVPASATEGREGGDWVIPAGQEELVRRMLDVDPKASGGYRFSAATLPVTEIIAVFEHVPNDDAALEDGPAVPSDEGPSARARSDGEPETREPITIRLVHPSRAPEGAPSTEKLALLLHDEDDEGEAGRIPRQLLGSLLDSVREDEKHFVWTRTSAGSMARTGTPAGSPPPSLRSSTIRSWLRSLAVVLVCLALFAGLRRWRA